MQGYARLQTLRKHVKIATNCALQVPDGSLADWVWVTGLGLGRKQNLVVGGVQRTM